MKTAIYRNPFIFSPPPCPSVGCAPSETQIYDQSSAAGHAIGREQQARHKSDANRRLKQVYLPRPAMPLSSLGSKDEEEEERCENAELRSEAVCTGLVVVAAAAVAAGGCGLHSPVRLSKGTGVIDAEVTSLVLTWGFTWFLLQRGKGENEQGQYYLESTLKTYW